MLRATMGCDQSECCIGKAQGQLRLIAIDCLDRTDVV
jgi:hypothetical protein